MSDPRLADPFEEDSDEKLEVELEGSAKQVRDLGVRLKASSLTLHQLLGPQERRILREMMEEQKTLEARIISMRSRLKINQLRRRAADLEEQIQASRQSKPQ